MLTHSNSLSHMKLPLLRSETTEEWQFHMARPNRSTNGQADERIFLVAVGLLRKMRLKGKLFHFRFIFIPTDNEGVMPRSQELQI